MEIRKSMVITKCHFVVQLHYIGLMWKQVFSQTSVDETIFNTLGCVKNTLTQHYLTNHKMGDKVQIIMQRQCTKYQSISSNKS